MCLRHNGVFCVILLKKHLGTHDPRKENDLSSIEIKKSEESEENEETRKTEEREESKETKESEEPKETEEIKETKDTKDNDKTKKEKQKNRKKSKKDKDSQDKTGEEKKKKLPLRRTIQNSLFALKQVWESSHSYFIIYYLMTFVYAPLDFLTGSYLIRIILNGVEKATSVSHIVTYMLIIGIADIVINCVNSLYWNMISPAQYQKISSNLQKKLFRKAGEVELACYETPAFYDKYVKAMDEAENRVLKVMRTLDNLIWRIISLLCNSFLLFAIDPVLIVFGILPLFLGIVRRWANKLSHDHSTARKPVERRQKYVRRTFYLNEYSKEMRIGGMYARMLGELDDSFREFRRILRRYGYKRALAAFIQNVGLEVITILGAMTYAVWRTLDDGSMSIGDCIVILNSIGTISYCLNNLIQGFAEFGEHALFLEDVRYFLDYEVKIVEDENAPPAPSYCAEIDVEHINFRYEGAESDTLHDVSIHIGAGERIALVGQNGSGKTTLVKLLLRLYDPTEGKVLLDGKEAKEYRLSAYRDNFSCVFQDFKVFSFSVKKNVLLRREKAGDDELVTDALKESGAYDKVMTLEDGIETTLTREFDDKGTNLSVGEQQKISLARVFAEKSHCVVLDEPSSALDPIAEHKMFENMMRAAKGRSVIFISHRLSSAVDADRIYLMEDGRITETGTHHELMQNGGKYAEMFHLQARNYIGDNTPEEEVTAK